MIKKLLQYIPTWLLYVIMLPIFLIILPVLAIMQWTEMILGADIMKKSTSMQEQKELDSHQTRQKELEELAKKMANNLNKNLLAEDKKTGKRNNRKQ